MRVLLFGSFDGIHEGHRYLFKKARALAEQRGEPVVTVVVARDSAVTSVKSRPPRYSQNERMSHVKNESVVDEVMLGDEWPTDDPYRLLGALDFDALLLGYDQGPGDEEVMNELSRRGKREVVVERAEPFKPEIYKSSLLNS